MDQKDEIIIQAENLFNRFGVKSVSMDDVAENLSISKKTLYQFFESKAELVECVLRRRLDALMQCILEHKKGSSNAVEETFGLFHTVIVQMRDMNPSMLYDMKKYYPHIFNEFREFMLTNIKGDLQKNLKRGVKEGLYRNDFNADLITELHFNTIEFIASPGLKDIEPDIEKRHTEILIYHLRAVCNTKGIELLERLLKENEK